MGSKYDIGKCMENRDNAILAVLLRKTLETYIPTTMITRVECTYMHVLFLMQKFI